MNRPAPAVFPIDIIFARSPDTAVVKNPPVLLTGSSLGQSDVVFIHRSGTDVFNNATQLILAAGGCSTLWCPPAEAPRVDLWQYGELILGPIRIGAVHSEGQEWRQIAESQL